MNARAPDAAGGERRVVRAPNHLGDMVMALPGLVADGSHVVVRSWLAPLLEMAGMGERILRLGPGPRGWARTVGALRRGRFQEGVLLTPSFSAAWLFLWGGVGRLRGTDTDGRGWMLSERIPRVSLTGLHRTAQYRMLLGQPAEGPMPGPALSPSPSLTDAWRRRLGGAEPVVGLFPGSNAPARRWPAERFAEVARALLAEGRRVVVVGGPGDSAAAGTVAAGAPGALNVCGETDLPGLAALLSQLRLLVTNDTGPMHLAAAVGIPTVSVWGPSDPEETSPPGAGHVLVTGPGLACMPCRRNHCPRSGRGTMLPDAHEECMRLVDAGRVLAAVQTILDGGRS